MKVLIYSREHGEDPIPEDDLSDFSHAEYVKRQMIRYENMGHRCTWFFVVCAAHVALALTVGAEWFAPIPMILGFGALGARSYAYRSASYYEALWLKGGR